MFTFDLGPFEKVKVKVMHIATVNVSQTVTNVASIAIAGTQKVASGLSIGIFTFDRGSFLKVKVKVVHLSTENILQTMTARTNITIANTESRMWSFDSHIYVLP